MAGSKLPGELTWPKLLGTTLAAVVAAWLAGHLHLGNTISGVAVGSVIATLGSAFFTTSINKSHQAIVVRTDRGTVIEASADSDVAGPASTDTAVLPAQPHASEPPAAASRWSRIHWRSVIIAAAVTMAVTLAAISIYEGAVGRTWGSNEPGTTIGNTVHGGPSTPSPTPTPTPTPSPTPTPTPTPTPASPSPTPTPDASPTPDATPTASPSPSPSPSPTDTLEPGLLNP